MAELSPAEIAEKLRGLGKVGLWFQLPAGLRDQIIAALDREREGERALGFREGIEMAVRWLRDANGLAAEALCDAIRVEVNWQHNLGCFFGQHYLDMVADAISKLADTQSNTSKVDP